jgi:hypothetical protein
VYFLTNLFPPVAASSLVFTRLYFDSLDFLFLLGQAKRKSKDIISQFKTCMYVGTCYEAFCVKIWYVDVYTESCRINKKD